ncbi:MULTISPECIES: hypothetical protein [unclassified Rhizobium]|uniref:hypothetical protein n=1 Tax=unclassified Rhizobium TaxID=2613769 RepID=UPI000BCDA6EF|nr:MULTISPECIES: hypothetical protein [unclassified Rhizobium]MDH7805732.1 nucleotide-binding universal stress UspA family protein [Rhizobium sp. AN67]MDQ4407206.1 hypothetical protein [Rhizobium sp. AN63]SOD59765.1 hypothetical protein SAMN05216595_4942 [Rhizobium sp. AN6A]
MSDDTEKDEQKTERFNMFMSPREMKAIDDWAWGNKIRSKSEAVRRLVQIGLAFERDAEPIMKRSERALKALLLTAEKMDGASRGGIVAAIDEQLHAYKAAVSAYIQASVMSETKFDAEIDELVNAAASLVTKLRDREPEK